MGTSLALAGNTTIKLSPGWNAFWYWGVWAVCIIGLGIVLWAALRSKRWARWTTQDILIVAALGVLLEVYDNIIGDQLISPLINPIPGADFSQIHDLPYMFLLMVGVALVRKLSCITAMIFVNYLLAQLLFGSGHGALDWTDGLTEGVFCDLYIVGRGGRVFGKGGLFNGIEAAVSAILAQRVAVSVMPSLGASRRRPGSAVDPFAEPRPDDQAVPLGRPAAENHGPGGESAVLAQPEARSTEGGLA